MLETGLSLTGLGVATVLLPFMTLWVCYVGLHMPTWLIENLAWDRKLRLLPLALVHMGLLLGLIAVAGRFLPGGITLLAMPFMALFIWCEWLRRERALI
ncbi:hypothetical protein HZF05_00385 [Sphingomonas sp. CGMCC 1.13654]|uniref:Uncharacterized protein n=1 Tax=Sphingomonas chungangi TaxID=2683589 RepID=A0A838L4F8_9SPHN|nr:hypothetical protein [Sphingomonas chungangi]MBA2932538.1 hypothetical protein [Sphingomonas chungangi]MVW56161.1 hypothetical protein [Sphingomonas chungangi]